MYFIPKDSSNRLDSHRRLSEILLQGQELYKQNMMSYGFGEKTFSLLEDTEKSRIKIIYLNGNHSASSYPYEGGGTKMIKEIHAYFSGNPSEKTAKF